MISNDSYSDNPFLKNISSSGNLGYNPYNNNPYRKPGSVNRPVVDSDDGHAAQENNNVVSISNAQKKFYYQPIILSWSGRLDRLRFFVYDLGINIAIAALILKMISLSEGNIFPPQYRLQAVAALVALICIKIAFSKRRLNDLNLNGWYSLVIFAPIADVFLYFYLLFAPGTSTPNSYGPLAKPADRLLMRSLAIIGIVLLFALLVKMYEISETIEFAKQDSLYSVQIAQ